MKELSQFSPSGRIRCARLVTVGGSPSYVELLTRLELAKQAKELPAADQLDTGKPTGTVRGLFRQGEAERSFQNRQKHSVL